MMETIAQKGAVVVAIGAFFTLLGVVIRSMLPYRKGLIDTLSERVTSLEAQLESTRTSLEAKLDEERARHDAEMQIMRHRLNNEAQSLEALLLLLEANPSRVVESVAAIKQMRADRDAALALEKGQISQSRIEKAASRTEATQ